MYLNLQIHDTQDTLTIRVGYIGDRDTFEDTYLEPYLRPRLDERWGDSLALLPRALRALAGATAGTGA